MSIEIISIYIISINILVYAALIILWIFNFKPNQGELNSYPKISILIACRNEAKNIASLIESLLKIDYPKEKLEIIIGNDASQDNTLSLLKTYKGITLYDITTSKSKLKGKMNVLAQLVEKSNGEYLFFTDADMTFNPNILKSLISNWDEKTGMAVGFSKVTGTNPFATLQNIDYTIGQGIMKVLTDISKPQYVSGNNMMVSRKAYDATGGYEKMDFHLTEDVLLMKEIIRQGFQVKSVFNSNSVAYTKPADSLSALIHQRKRWMQGFSLMPISTYIISFSKLLFIPAIIYLLFSYPIFALLLYSLKLFSTATFIILINKKIKQKQNIIPLIFYDLYELVVYFPALILHFISKTNTWKGRHY